MNELKQKLRVSTDGAAQSTGAAGGEVGPGPRSRMLYDDACALMPGGVSSPVRAFRAVGGTPVFISRAAGSRIADVDGNVYVDYIGGWGALVCGHAAPSIVRSIAREALRGVPFGTSTAHEINLARRLMDALPSLERMRFVSTGTEAVMSALRVARAATSRPLVLKFDGAYHGHADVVLAAAGSGLLTSGLASSPGVPMEVAVLTVSVPYNDAEAVRSVLAEVDPKIAAVIVEPVAANMGVVPPVAGFLEELREVTTRRGSLLIFDEVITGFRVGWGGAQGRYGVQPDLTCLGKIIGGGLPAAAYGGRADLLSLLAPEGPVYQAGTYSGHPLAMRAGCETLKILQSPGTYERLEFLGGMLETGLHEAAIRRGIPLTVNRVGSMLTPFFTAAPVTDLASARRSDTDAYSRFFHIMLQQGVLLPPSQFEAWFVSLAHDEQMITSTISKCEKALAEIA